MGRLVARPHALLGAVLLLVGAFFLLEGASSALAVSYEEAVEGTSGISHFWPMGESSGSSFADVVGGANAEVSSSGVTLGEPGGLVGDSSTSALFDGSSGAAQAKVDLSGTHELTIEFWMKWHAFAGDDHLALEFTPNFNENPGGFLVDPDATPGSDFAVAVGQYGLGHNNNVLFERPSAEQWHYYAFVIDTEASGETEITPYVDGHAVSYTKLASGAGAGNFADSTLYWMSRDASSLFGAGTMQDLALYDTALSPEAILGHYEIGGGGPKASFSSSPVDATVGVPVRLDASVSSSPSGIADYAWDFDGSKSYSSDTGSSATTAHTFSTAGTYTVDLRVKDGFGETATVSHTITVGAALGRYEQAVEDTTGVSHFWPMDESSGSSFADVFGGANATTSGGVTLGEPGGLVEDSSTSASFDGSSGAAQAPVDLSGTSKLTVEFWMKWHAFAGDDHLALELTPNFNENPGGFLVDPDATPGSDFAVAVGQYGLGHNNNVLFERPSAEQWHYYAFVIDTEASGETEITPYVDGHAVSYTKLASGTGAGNFADSTLYWMSRDASSLFGAGSMQDLALYESTLSSETILEHYERGKNTYDVTNTTAPSIEGTAEDGETLRASPGSWSGFEPISYAYQWQSCNLDGEECDDIEGATGQTYTSTSADLETTLRVVVTANNAGSSAHATSAASAEIESGAPSELEPPSVSGDPSEGETLHGEAGQWGGTENEVGYQWERCNSAGGECADVAGATESDYRLTEGDVGSTLRLRVGVSDALGAVTAISAATEAIGPVSKLMNTLAPSITGTPQSGHVLSANAGSWLGVTSISYTYQWQKCNVYGAACENITGATSSSYTLGTGNVGSTIRVRVHASEEEGAVYETSAATQPIAASTAPVVEAPPAVSGTGLVGDKVTATTGAWTGEAPVSYGYQWERCDEYGESCSSISGATASTYTLTESDATHTVRVLVTATDAGAGSTKAASFPLAVSAATLVNVVAPSATGTHEVDRVLSADRGIWTGEGALAYTYKWERCNEKGESCSTITGATESSYRAASADVGKTLRVVVTAEGTAGKESANSAVTPVIGSESLAPTNLFAPTIEGNLTPGETLTAQTGTWVSSETITYTYQWQKCNEEGEECANISGATSSTYVLVEDDVDSTLRVVVTGKNTLGTASATSEQTEVVGAPGPPAIDGEGPAIHGTTQVGQSVVAGVGQWSGSRPLTYTYRWERCNPSGESCATIEHATKTSYTITSEDAGHTLRVAVTATNALASATARSATAAVSAAGEASATPALELAEETDPSVLAPAETATLEEQTVKPQIANSGELIAANTALTSSTISKETPGEFTVNTSVGELSLQPLESSPSATATPLIVNGATALYAETEQATDTFVRPTPLGAAALLQLRSAQAPASFSWEVGLGSDQELERLPDGDVAVIEPSSGPDLESELPTEGIEPPEAESAETPTEEGQSQEDAETELESGLSGEEPLEKLAAAPETTTPEVTPRSGELHPQDSKAQYERASESMASAATETGDTTIMIIQAPRVMDAEGNSVPATLSVEGNTVTMAITTSKIAKWPATAELAIGAPTDQASAAKAPSGQYGFSDPHENTFGVEGKIVVGGKETPAWFDNLDPKLKTGPLHVKRARLFLNYNAAPSDPHLNRWLKAVSVAGLTPMITFQRCKPFLGSKSCPNHEVTQEEYRKDVKALIKALINGGPGRPAVRIWGSWNEPDGKGTSLRARKAAELWGETQRAAEEAGCKHHCTVVAGEFQEYGNHRGYITNYQKDIVAAQRKDKFPVKVKPHTWGFHDYQDLLQIKGVYEKEHEVLANYANPEAQGYVRATKRLFRSAHVWATEQGVLLQNNTTETTSYTHPELQRLGAKDFLRLGRPSEHIEWAYYYLYHGPSEARLEVPEHEHEFDSALLPGEGVIEEDHHPAENPRQAYCVLALGLEGCPATSKTQAVISSTITSSAGTVSLDVNPEGLATKYMIEYGTTEAYGKTTTATAAANESGDQSETVTLSGLEACTTYHYQAEAENEANEEEKEPGLGGDDTFTTSGCPPTVMTGSLFWPEPHNCFGEGYNTLELTGEINPNGLPSTYYFEYSLKNEEADEFKTPTQSAGSGTNPIKVNAKIEVEDPVRQCWSIAYRLVGVNSLGTNYGEILKAYETV